MKNLLMKCKRGGISTALLDFWSYIALVIIALVFYGMFTFQASSIRENKIISYQNSLRSDIQLISYLKVPVIIDGKQITIADFIALSDIDPAKKETLKNTILQNMDRYFGTSACSIICINNDVLKGSGCPSRLSLQVYICPSNYAWIPSYTKNPIRISLDIDSQSINSQDLPVS